jgi:hypothetical protein
MVIAKPKNDAEDKPVLLRVDIKDYTHVLQELRGKDYVTVTPVWSGVDRQYDCSWVCLRKNAMRLQQAILAGKVLINPRIATDVNGKTYVAHGGFLKVSAKYINADLKRLGF